MHERGKEMYRGLRWGNLWERDDLDELGADGKTV
jgi:hypothetical protein